MKLDGPALTRKLLFFNTIIPPTIIFGPGEPELPPKADEFCNMAKMELAIKAFTRSRGDGARYLARHVARVDCSGEVLLDGGAL